MKAVEMLKKHEGFRSKVYKDHLGNPTVGYGFTYLTKEESEVILQMKAEKLENRLSKYKWFENLNQNRKAAIINMAYQLGVSGLLNFKNMITAIRSKDYIKAKQEALNSLWARQTPNRAKEIANIIEKGE